MALKKVRRILQNLEKRHGTDYFSLHRRNGNLHLLTDGEAVYLEDSPQQIVDIFSESAKGMYSVPVSKLIAKLEHSEQGRKPVRSETARARRTLVSKAS